MARKRAWYGRPNPPPLSWERPDKSILRRVTVQADDILPVHLETTTSGGIPVSLKNEQWIAILKALKVYGVEHDEKDWQTWCFNVRKAILGAVNPNTDASQSVAVRLAIEDWRQIWSCLRTISQKRGGRWTTWFNWLSQEMARQINDSEQR